MCVKQLKFEEEELCVALLLRILIVFEITIKT